MELNIPTVRWYEDSGAGVIVLADSSNGNVLNPEMLREFRAGLESFRGNDGRENTDIRFVLVRSNGSSFCHGMDLGALTSETGADSETLTAAIRAYAELLIAIDRFPVPVVAVVEGSVKAGGCGIVAACDIVLAGKSASFELSEILLGLLPANVMPYVIGRRVAAKQAQYLVLTGTLIGAEKALSIGLVDGLHEDLELEKAVLKLGRQLCRTAIGATQRYKQFAADLDKIKFEDQPERAIREILSLAGDPEIRQTIALFRDGELPPWFKRFKPTKPLTGAADARSH